MPDITTPADFSGGEHSNTRGHTEFILRQSVNKFEPVAGEAATAVFVIQADAVMRITLKHIIEKVDSLQHVGSESPEGKVVEELHRTHPALLLLDTAAGGSLRLNLIKRIQQAAPDCRILLVSSLASPAAVTEAFAAGVHGYLLKSEIAGGLLQAITTTCTGRQYVGSWVSDSPLIKT
jgi:DNA-binding NarL/FixJ family response regulator